ncbi:hypothetical protein CYLTODRAFT_401441 [Cylindrobasidium torrendii FP15055 ss-10]|uniref:LysM domain-containing protein n=1 Tax=Cylindrobasidium torrendii FP15055 ss-10 TaxID=1314674 RepID=A0A0D7B5J4_9AGAR|nr:hypothetical protein CYLTODRAFT_401441 [Cylindrobasidium torrendii FP15055 ss-10]
MASFNTDHDLCLACSSSFSSSSREKPYVTSCCERPICSRCVTANPRLMRYNPCLSCLGGVGVIAVGSGKANSTQSTNIDGAVRDQDNFAIGDDDEEEEAPPAYPTATSNVQAIPPNDEALSAQHNSISEPESSTVSYSTDDASDTVRPLRYFIKRSDTLQGIALRFSVDGRDLCRINNLPPSTLTLTPHILHTRDSIELPPGARASEKDLNKPSAEEQHQREARRVEKRLQVVAKEADWRVARAYVALAEHPETLGDMKKKSDMESRALDQYLDDEEWSRTAGKPRIEGFPYFTQAPSSSKVGGSSPRWKFW